MNYRSILHNNKLYKIVGGYMIELKIRRDKFLEQIASMRYDELSEIQIHHIFLEFGYLDTEHYMATGDNVYNNEQNEH